MVGKRAGSNRLDRNAVLEAACAIVDRDGFTGLTLAALAAQLDRHSSSLYNHVEGLDGLRHDVITKSLEELGERLWRAALGKSGEDGLRALAAAYRTYAVEHPGRFEAATSWRGEVPQREWSLGVAQPAGDAIRAVMVSFGLDEVAVAHATRVFASSVVGCIRAEGRAPDDETFDALVDLFVFGLTGTPWLRKGVPAH